MGSTDVPLDEVGISQAMRLRDRMRGVKVDRVYSSDSMRSSRFAGMVFEGMKIETLAGLREMSFGIIEGLTYDQIMEAHPEVYSDWLKDVHASSIPGGESIDALTQRVMDSYRSIVAGNEGAVVAVVTHAGPIRVIIQSASKGEAFWDIMPDSAGVSVIEHDSTGPKILMYNDTAHLEDG
jgi:broad specificity phosphatase PhoE